MRVASLGLGVALGLTELRTPSAPG